MAGKEKMIEFQKYEGEPYRFTDISGEGICVTPQSQALLLRWPNGGFVWNRPVAILVEKDGQVQRKQIVDVTRLLQVILWGVGGLFALGALIFQLKNERKDE